LGSVGVEFEEFFAYVGVLERVVESSFDVGCVGDFCCVEAAEAKGDAGVVEVSKSFLDSPVGTSDFGQVRHCFVGE